MKSSFHSLIPFLLLFCCCKFWRLGSVQFPCSKAHILSSWRLETRPTLLNWNLLYNRFALTTQKTQLLYCWEVVFRAPLLFDCCLRIRCRGNVFTESLPSNERLFCLHYSGCRTSCHSMFPIHSAPPPPQGIRHHYTSVGLICVKSLFAQWQIQ
jgi:hypothetical protein